MSQMIFLNSKDRSSGENYRPRWSIQDPAFQLLDNFTVALVQFSVPNSVYPINQFNNRFYIIEAPAVTPTTLEVPYGAYTATELVNALLLLLNGDPSLLQTYTVNYDYSAKILTVSSSGTFTLYTSDDDYNIYDEIGFDTSLFTSGGGSSFSGSYPLNLSGSSYVDILTNFSTMNYSSSASTNILARVPIGVGFHEILSYEPASEVPIYVNASQLHEVYLALRDDKGNQWILPDNAKISLVLKIAPSQ